MRSVTDSDGRRLITLGHLPRDPRTFLSAASRDKTIVRIETTFSLEELSGFQPLIRGLRLLRRSLIYPAGTLNP